jgi:hypothetical protein
VLGVGISRPHLGYDLHHRTWGIPLKAVLAILPVELDKLGKVHIGAESILHVALVEHKTIRSKLNPTPQPLGQVVEEIPRGFLRALAYGVNRDELAFLVNGHKNPLVAQLLGIVVP